tara:strand:- start:26378 stop:27148 length:771 start_codon:yes stop_codon:yes gene_type:complete
MIKFFRNIRKSLLNQGKNGKYLKYAVGEIVLVVIGILIALQINNWNETNKDLKKEQKILNSLLTAFKENLALIVEAHNSTDIAYYATLDLKEQIKPQTSEFNTKRIDTILSLMFGYSAFDPASGAIDEVINSGQLNLIQNKELKNEISKWSSKIIDTQTDLEITNGYLFNEIIIYLSKNAHITNLLIDKSILEYTKLSPIPPSSFNKDYTYIMGSLEFENMVNWHAINLAYLANEYQYLQTYLEHIIELIHNEINH